MGITPEKNDVDISRLFNWGAGFSILDSHSTEIIKYYARVIGDADLNKARVYALRESSALRTKLKDKNSEEFIAYQVDEDLLSKEQLVESTLYFVAKDIGKNVAKDINVSFPKEPDSEATLEQQENYQKEVDAYPKKLNEAINAELNKLVEKERSKIESKDKHNLYTDYMINITNDLCEKEMLTKFNDACVFYSAYKDSAYKERLFESIEQFQNTPRELKQQFENNYSTLEIDMDALKKLEEVMQ